MTSNDGRSRIDQVFADGRWVREALTAARADALERHRRAGVPMVVVRDGRIVHVPAEELVPDVETLLVDADFAANRTARELTAWFEERRAAINGCLKVKEPALLHLGRFKKFYEELYPFALWVGHRYPDRDDVMCSLNPSTNADSDYDALVTEATDPPTVTYVQLTTTTFDRNESRRMEHLIEHGWTAARWGHVNEAGEAELEWLSQEERLARTFADLERVTRRKSKFPDGPSYVLVVSFDDFMWFGTEDDRAALTAFVTAALPSWRLRVATLDVVGISGRTFLSFPNPTTSR